MKKSKSFPFIVASLLLCMPLSACNLNLSVNENKNSSSSSETSSSSSSSSSGEEGNDPNPTTEVSLDEFLALGQEALKNNPGYQSVDVKLKLSSEGDDYDITAQYAKEEEGDNWELFTELSAGEENYPYYFALDFLSVHPNQMGYITQQYKNSKFYHDASGFKYVGSVQGEEGGVQYESNLFVLFDSYGYCVKVIQDQKAGGQVYYSIDFHAKYSTTSLGGGTNPITDEVTKEQFITAAEQAIQVEPGYKSAKIRYVLSGVDLYGNISLSANYSRDIQTGKWKYHSGDSSLTFDYMISMYLETRLDRDTVGEQTSYQDIHFYMDNSGFRMTFKSKTSIDGETYIDISNEATWDKYGFMTLYETKPVDASTTSYHHLFTAKYSTNNLTGGDNPMTEIEGERISESEWEDYCDSVAMVNSGYKSAVLSGTYETKTDLNGQSSGSGTAAKLYFANTMGGKTTWEFHHSEGTESLMDFFDDLIYTTPGYFLSASLNVIFSQTRDAYIATVIGSGYYSVGRFDPSTGYIVSAKTIIDIGDSNKSKFEILNCTITYSKDELQGGEQQADELTASEWKEYAEKVASVNKGYKSATLTGYVAEEKINSGDNSTVPATTIYYSNSKGGKLTWEKHHVEGYEAAVPTLGGLINISPSNFINFDVGDVSFSISGKLYVANIVGTGYTSTVKFDSDGYIVYIKTITIDAETKETILANISYSFMELNNQQIEDGMTLEEWKKYANEATKLDIPYRSAEVTIDQEILGSSSRAIANLNNPEGGRDTWTLHSHTGDDNVAKNAVEIVKMSPLSVIVSDPETFEGTIKYVEHDGIYIATIRQDEATIDYRFDSYGMLLGYSISADKVSICAIVDYSTTPLEGQGEGGGQEQGNMTRSDWETFCGEVAKTDMPYRSAYASVAQTADGASSKIMVTLVNQTGIRGEWSIYNIEGDDVEGISDNASFVANVLPSNYLVPEEGFTGTVIYNKNDDNNYSVTITHNGVTFSAIFDTYGVCVSYSASYGDASLSVSMKYSTQVIAIPQTGYDETVRSLEGQEMFVVGGDPTLGWDFDKNNIMTAASIKDVADYSESVAKHLQSIKNDVTYIYTKRVTLGTAAADWKTPIMMNGCKFMTNGSLTIKAHSGYYDDENERYESTGWYPDHDTSNLENLSPSTLFIPGWYEQDVYGMGWQNNPVAYEPGEYILVIVGYDCAADVGYYSGGMALIRVGDVESTINEPELVAGYGLLVCGRGSEAYNLSVNPYNPYELMAINVYVRAGETIQMLNVVNNDQWTITNLNVASEGFEVNDKGELVCMESGYYDFYITIASGGDAIYIGKSEAN